MNVETFEKYRDLIRNTCGIYLSDEKLPLLTNRIAKRLRKLGITRADDYFELLRRDTSGNELVHLIDAISTNVTHFFREKEHFDVLRQILSSPGVSSQNRWRIWCAASSSGEEPYTIAMICNEVFGSRIHSMDVKILATDICTEVLEKARDGVYQQKQLLEVPKEMLNKYFARDSVNREMLRIDSSLKKLIIFKRLNLAKFPFPLNSQVDIIFCRNVMIYFERSLRQRITQEFSRLLRPGGHLFLSRSENLLGIEHGFVGVSTSVYQNKN